MSLTSILKAPLCAFSLNIKDEQVFSESKLNHIEYDMCDSYASIKGFFRMG